MLDSMERSRAASRQRLRSRSSRAMMTCEALERRELLSRGMGLDALGAMGFDRQSGSLQAELGGFAGGRPGAMFGSGTLGVGGGMKSPIFLLTASLLNSGSGSTTPPSRSVLSSSAVQSAFQTLQTDLNDDVTVGSKPTHATVGQLEDDLQSIRKGKLTGSAATTAIQNDEAAILTSMGLSSSAVSQIQSDLQAVQSAIQSASSSTGTTSGGTTTTSTDGTTTTAGTAASSTNPATPASSSAVQSAFQALQSDLKSDLSSTAQPTNVSIGQVMDDVDAIENGKLTGSQAVTTIQTDTAALWSSMGLTQAQVTQIQSDQAAVASAIQSSASSSSSSTSSGQLEWIADEYRRGRGDDAVGSTVSHRRARRRRGGIQRGRIRRREYRRIRRPERQGVRRPRRRRTDDPPDERSGRNGRGWRVLHLPDERCRRTRDGRPDDLRDEWARRPRHRHLEPRRSPAAAVRVAEDRPARPTRSDHPRGGRPDRTRPEDRAGPIRAP